MYTVMTFGSFPERFPLQLGSLLLGIPSLAAKALKCGVLFELLLCSEPEFLGSSDYNVARVSRPRVAQ